MSLMPKHLCCLLHVLESLFSCHFETAAVKQASTESHIEDAAKVCHVVLCHH